MKKDKVIEQLLSEIETQKSEIKNFKKPQLKTNMSLTYNNDRLNLNVQQDDKLIEILAWLNVYQSSYLEMKNKHNLTVEFKPSNYTFEEWEHDIVWRLKSLEISEKKKDLAVKESRLKDLRSQDRKEELEIEEIMNSLKS